MAAKARLMGDERTFAAILAAVDPAAVKALGRAVAPYDEATWAAARYGVAVRCNMLKFAQNMDMRHLLLSTGERQLAEAAPRDPVWGIGITADAARAGAPWQGQNLLGRALMEVRSYLRHDPAFAECDRGVGLGSHGGGGGGPPGFAAVGGAAAGAGGAAHGGSAPPFAPEGTGGPSGSGEAGAGSALHVDQSGFTLGHGVPVRTEGGGFAYQLHLFCSTPGCGRTHPSSSSPGEGAPSTFCCAPLCGHGWAAAQHGVRRRGRPVCGSGREPEPAQPSAHVRAP